MRLVKKILVVIICFIIAISLFGCSYLANKLELKSTGAQTDVTTQDEYDPNKTYTEDEIAQKIIELVAIQEEAMLTANEELIIETINPVDKWLQLEAMHLVADQKTTPVSQYTKSISDIKKEGAYYIGTVKQSFVFEGINKESIEHRYYMFEQGKAYDMGTALDKSMFGNVFAAFPSDKYELTKRLSNILNVYVDTINTMWKAEFVGPVSIKIYDDKNTFLYNTKLSMPDWVGGWYESGESIKTYIYDTPQETYEYLMRHEATHMLLAHVTNDNAAYWMQEGFATTMPEYIANNNLMINRKDALKDAYDTDRLPTVREHVNTNLENLTEMFDVRLYYAYSSAMVVYLLERTDDITLNKLFDELKTFPYISLTAGEKVSNTQDFTEKCFKKATGQSFEAFYSGFDEWIKGKLS